MIEQIYEKLITELGFTANKNLELVDDNLHFLVSYEGGISFGLEDLTFDKFKLAIEFLNPVYNEYIGGWIDEGIVYLDKSINFKHRKDAEKFGREQHQKAIFNYTTKENVYLE